MSTSVLAEELSQNDVIKQLPLWCPLPLTRVFLRTGTRLAYADSFFPTVTAYAETETFTNCIRVYSNHFICIFTAKGAQRGSSQGTIERPQTS